MENLFCFKFNIIYESESNYAKAGWSVSVFQSFYGNTVRKYR